MELTTLWVVTLPSFREGSFVLNGVLYLDYKAEHGNTDGFTMSSIDKDGKIVERNAPTSKQTDVLYEKLLQVSK